MKLTTLEDYLKLNFGKLKDNEYYNEESCNIVFDYLASTGNELTKQDETFLNDNGYKLRDFEIEGIDYSKILEDLVNKENNIFKYSQLPLAGKKAIDIFYKNENGFEIDEDDTFKYLEVPINILKDAIGCPEDLDGLGLNGFEAYHQWYLDGGDIPNHKDVYAVLLSGDEEVIYDGWHRFHNYVKLNIPIVPCVIPYNTEDTACL